METAVVESGWYHEQDGPHRGLLVGEEWAAPGDGGKAAMVAALIDKRRRFAPPCQLRVPKGAVAVRDNRCFHAGQPNRTGRTGLADGPGQAAGQAGPARFSLEGLKGRIVWTCICCRHACVPAHICICRHIC